MPIYSSLFKQSTLDRSSHLTLVRPSLAKASTKPETAVTRAQATSVGLVKEHVRRKVGPCSLFTRGTRIIGLEHSFEDLLGALRMAGVVELESRPRPSNVPSSAIFPFATMLEEPDFAEGND
ncbi:unnamed protein product [Protopolystoma xenopodis]|uniref:Uncharacterized protein n=1 Tax=Protopolystoma xenopodis TaxID=117903 RepID=A0A3S5C418_9PLAT|nr:unnamed protein product [Protopolystoma xenopodis]